MGSKKSEENFIDNIKWLVIGLVIAFVFLQILGFAVKTDVPVVAVVSPSMRHDGNKFENWLVEEGLVREAREWPFEHGFREGDMIIVIGAAKEDIRVGDVIVYGPPQNCYHVNPIIHRVVDANDEGFIVKGDNNDNPDCGGNAIPYEWVRGKAVVAVPDAGLPRYLLREFTGF